MFLSLDGADGVGKSTQAALLADWLRSGGVDVVTCRDPGATETGEAIRGLLLDKEDLEISRTAEMLLYMAARAQLVEEVIRPAIAVGKTVVSDRYLLANLVYQGYAGGLDVEQIREVGRLATGGLMPTLTLLLDMPADAAAGRIDRARDRMELQGEEFRDRLRQGFLAEAARAPDRIIVIDASRSTEHVQADIRAAVAGVKVEPASRRTP